MDMNALSTLLQRTLDPAAGQAAEAELKQARKIIGFCPGILQVVMNNAVEPAVRQAGVIYFKNLVNSSWVPKDNSQPSVLESLTGKTKDPEDEFCIHEQDKAFIRDNIVQATVEAPDAIRIQLALCVSKIIRHDFPERWPQVVDKIYLYLNTPEPAGWPGALACLYRLVKNYEYKNGKERAPLKDAMNLLLPKICEIIEGLMPNQSADATGIKKGVLKIYYALTQFNMPQDLINQQFFTRWMEILRQVVEQDVPAEALSEEVEDDEKPMLIWWKQKKWALRILTRFFDRYGSPGNVTSEYKKFSEWYLKTFSQGILGAILKVLDTQRRKIYVSPRVVQLSLDYVNTGVSHALTWKIMKPHIFEIIRDVLFPLMSHTEADAELWESDPYEYVRVKFNIFEEFVSPVNAAQSVLHSVCKKRKDVLPKTVGLLMGIVNDPNMAPAQKDGALHMIGSVSDILLKTKVYKDQMEQFLRSVVFPEFSSPHGHLRARACWMLHHFADVKFKDRSVLGECLNLTVNSLLKQGEEVPVKVEAAIALQMLLDSQGDKTRVFVEPRVKEITLELLNVIRDTESEDLTAVLQKIVSEYKEQLTPVAIDMCKHLVETFAQVLESSESEDKAITAMGLLNTLETILTVMSDNEVLYAQLEPVVLQAVHHIFTNSFAEFYEEAFELACDLTNSNVSENMWNMLGVIYQVFEKDGIDYFNDMMPVLHNYVTVDTNAFITRNNGESANTVFNMCKKMLLEADPGDDPECHAAKLLEVIILQCKGKHNIDAMIPSFIEVAFLRLAKDPDSVELRIACLNMAIAAMYYNGPLFFQTLHNSAVPGVQQGSLLKFFVEQWLKDPELITGIHDRKLSVLGLCQLMSVAPEVPDLIDGGFTSKFMPTLLMLFDGLKKAYEAAAEEEESSDEDSDEEEEDADASLLSSDEDEIDEESAVYLESLQNKIKKATNGNVSGDIEDDEEEESDAEDEFDFDDNVLEGFTTPLDEDDAVDEYEVFKTVIQSIEGQNPELYRRLTSSLTPNDGKSIQEVFKLAELRIAAQRSKNLEKAGGFQFSPVVPSQFNFANGSNGTNGTNGFGH